MPPRKYAIWPYLRGSTAHRALQHASASPTLVSLSLAYCERTLGAPAGTATMAASVSARGGAHRGCACRVDDSLSTGASLSSGSGGLARRRVSRAGGGRADVERADDHCSPLRVSGAQDAQPLSLLIPRRRAGGRLG